MPLATPRQYAAMLNAAADGAYAYAAINATSNAEVTAVWSSRALDSGELSRQHGGSIRAYTNLEEMLRSAEIDASHITVETNGSEVILRGTVRSWAERREAERAAWAAPGVTKVDNRITISV